ncbi:MAG: DEAD/DEAH box helicase family protein [Christensenellaceae bacterium]|jgi:predicted helicase|nr:DEAD/DEAH box helicase family protein [Christensenellaceae bacterium]
MSIYNVLEKIKTNISNKSKQGTSFELLICYYLLTDPKYFNEIMNVWLWSAFPYKNQFGTGHDVGIDIVVCTKDLKYWAIQCKFYAENTKITKSDIDTFMSTSSRHFKVGDFYESFSLRILISTSDNWTQNALASFENQHPPATRISMNKLQESGVDWQKLYDGITGIHARAQIYDLFDYQKKAVSLACNYFETNVRGKLIMPCGTGKTIVSLHIARKLATTYQLVLFCVPSISLVSQILTEWSNQSEYNALNNICVCSDPNVSSRDFTQDDMPISRTIDLAYPASTNPFEVYEKYLKNNNKLTVIFATYHSIDVLVEAQKLGLPTFDLIICDEAHRTAGILENNIDASHFIKVHNNEYVKGKLRLYMTATPRLYSDSAKKQADLNSIIVFSMDDPSIYGNEIYKLSFSEAVELKRLTDYKVVVLGINDDAYNDYDATDILDVPDEHGNRKSKQQLTIELNMTFKLLGCINALSKKLINGDSLDLEDPGFMKRALAFSQNITISNHVANAFNRLYEKYIQNELESKNLTPVVCKHIDGKMNSTVRDKLLNWLKFDEDNDKCKILSNVRCLSEGIDVPALDAIIFLTGKNSIIDIVQSVGRVMRRALGKKYGYVIIPVIVPSFMTPDLVFENNNTYKVIWQVLNALRAHDERLDNIIQQIVENIQKPTKLIIGTVKGNYRRHIISDDSRESLIEEIFLKNNQNFIDTIYAKIIEHSSLTSRWMNWADNVAHLVNLHIENLTLLSKTEECESLFDDFTTSLKTNLNNPTISKSSVIEMLVQHKITEPVFDALFENYQFARYNPIAIELNAFIEKLPLSASINTTDELKSFYENVKLFVSNIDNAKGKQNIILKLYNMFFKKAFPQLVQKLGIVYTPIEIVDFIIHSTNDVLMAEFGNSLTEENINILDPFAGTGTFITRILQSNLIKNSDLSRKFNKELFANEIVLLAYYIASVNIESEFYLRDNPRKYVGFKGICLTDTFSSGENDQLKFALSENANRIINQENCHITVIMGNPPYSVHGSKDDLNANVKYKNLDRKILKTYISSSNAKNLKSIYDSYIRAFRWATDKIGNNDGIISFVSNGSWLTSLSCDGLRKSFEKEFSKIYICDLRGDHRITSEKSSSEGDNVFGRGSRSPITITILVKRRGFKGRAEIFYHNIGDYMNKNAKLDALSRLHSFLSPNMPQMRRLTPSAHGDWLFAHNAEYKTFYPAIISKNDVHANQKIPVFLIHALAITTCRDFWVYDYSKESCLIKC